TVSTDLVEGQRALPVGDGARSDDELWRDDRSGLGTLPRAGLDRAHENGEATTADLAEILPDRRERRREVRSLGRVVEADHRDLVRDSALGLVHRPQQAEGHL